MIGVGIVILGGIAVDFIRLGDILELFHVTGADRFLWLHTLPKVHCIHLIHLIHLPTHARLGVVLGIHWTHALLEHVVVVAEFGLRTGLFEDLIAQVRREYLLVVEVHPCCCVLG